MKRSSIRRYCSIFCAMLMLVSCIGNSLIALGADNVREAKKMDVWDFGAVEETNTNIYANHITAADWEATPNVGADAKFTGGTIVFGDLTLSHASGDRLYSISNKNYGTSAAATTQYEDGYKANGQYYANGTGGTGRRHMTIVNVNAGDKFWVYMGLSTFVDGAELNFECTQGGTQLDTASITKEMKRYEFVAQNSGTYKIWTGSVGKPVYNRIVRIPGAAVSGTVEGSVSVPDTAKIVFTSNKTGVKTEVAVSGGKFSAVLAADDTYTASLSGFAGYGITNDSKFVEVTTTDALSGKTDVKLVVEEKSMYTYSGKITGFASDYDVTKLAVKLVADKESLADDVTLTMDSNLGFTAQLQPDVKYTVELSGVNDYKVTEGGLVSGNTNITADIKVALKEVYKVSGGFKELGADGKVTELTFKNVDDGYTYKASVTASGYEVQLRDGSYEAVTTVANYKTTTHVVVNGGEVKKDLLFVSTKKPESKPLVKDIYVGYTDKGELNYNTINEAVAACAAMNPTKEEDRITVHIAPGTYREQVILTTPYVSFVNDTNREVLLTWYYGIGYKYYSVDSSGFYNEENAYDKYQKLTAAKWGCSVYVRNTATAFKASGITFEASFNRYITDEELEDGVEPSGGEAITLERKYGTDVTSKTATERATALAIEADKSELVNCKFYSSQDTLYTGNASIYFKNCFIEGNTDYIFGSGNCVFDGCQLNWKGYSDKALSGYITAQRPDDKTTDKQLGYLFRNCVVTADTKLQVAGGYWGRPWGANATVAFLNTKLDNPSLITEAGWIEMSGNKPENANYKEYNTTSLDGENVDTSKRVVAPISSDTASKIDVKAYFGDWTPTNYVGDETSVAFSTQPYVTDNGDINAPYPGHKLTVGYSFGAKQDAQDASVIKWYIVDTDKKETLIKATTANISNTCIIPKEAIGKKIKVVVEPELLNGTKGTTASYTVEEDVRDGFEDPSGGSSDIILGNGVNVFLAGDSTVKDYSANGMYMGGKAQQEGSWGEFIQTFFDESKVAIQNYANGGRSTRNFINEGSLDKIKQNIKEGDYLFIQFGHNDCANGAGYTEERYAPLGTPDANGIYPSTPGTKVNTPSNLVDKYGEQFYSYDCGGTYKWYLQQYIDAAREKGAIPVLVTPVSRLYYDDKGNIRPHHDSTDKTTNTQVTSNNAYVQAVKQLASEQDVLLIDAFELTKDMYEAAYKADPAAGNKKSPLGSETMADGDSTHSNKTGGFLSAALIVKAIQGLDLNIAAAVQMPSKTGGINPNGQQPFVVNGSGEFTAYARDEEKNYTMESEYWTKIGNDMLAEIKNAIPEVPDIPDVPVDPVGKLGDVDGDGKIDIRDGVMIRKYLAKMSVEINTANSDVNKDGTINTVDAVLILKKIAKMDVGF